MFNSILERKITQETRDNLLKPLELKQFSSRESLNLSLTSLSVRTSDNMILSPSLRSDESSPSSDESSPISPTNESPSSLSSQLRPSKSFLHYAADSCRICRRRFLVHGQSRRRFFSSTFRVGHGL